MQILTLGILYYLQEKRSHEYNPRLGRSSMAVAADDDNNQVSPAPRNSNQALFAPRLGKKSLEFSPRLGRSFYSGNLWLSLLNSGSIVLIFCARQEIVLIRNFFPYFSPNRITSQINNMNWAQSLDTTLIP